MDKNAIKKFAVWARNELIERVSKKAMVYGIAENEVIDPNADSVNGIVLTAAQKKERQALIELIFAKGYQQVMEEVAYTWFNRFCALRFMEVNNYLPSLVRVFTNNKNEFRPQILTEALEVDLEGLDKAKLYELKEANADEELYKYLLITQCNALNKELPKMFQKIEDYTELLFPDNLLREGSVVEQMIKLIPEEDWKDAVQIIGWLYQYYNIEPKNAVFANLKKNIKISKKDIPAATQLFTPDWIVRYMVENSLGRMWVEGHPDDELKAGWKYYLEEAQQEPEVEQELVKIREQYASLQVSDIKCIDPCMGSGHILAYMFDVLMEIYKKEGYRNRDAVKNIINCNLYGLDIDERASQLAYFAVMMKGRQYDDSFLERNYQPHVHAIVESNGIDRELLTYFGVEMDEFSRENANNQLNGLLDAMHDACEYGSIITVPEYDFDLLKEYVAEYDPESDLFASKDLGPLQERLQELIAVGEILSRKYEVVVTNPPYMGAGGMGAKLSAFVKKYYPNTKSDMSTVCMDKSLALCCKGGFMAMINIPVWMYLSSFVAFRNNTLDEKSIMNLLYFGRGVFGSDFGTTAFVFLNHKIINYNGAYKKLFNKKVEVESLEIKRNKFFENSGVYYNKQENFKKVTGNPYAFNMTNDMLKTFENGVVIDKIASPRQGMATGNNDIYLRLWYEVNNQDLLTNAINTESFHRTNKKYAPYNKGGAYRKWYGNQDYVIRFDLPTYEILATVGNHLPSRQYYFRESLTWSKVTMGGFSMRYMPCGFVFDVSGCSVFSEHNITYQILGLLNSILALNYFSFFSPTVNYEVGNLKSIPYIYNNKDSVINKIVVQNINISKNDWDSFETSWDFQKHSLMPQMELGSEAVFIDKEKKLGSVSVPDIKLQDEYERVKEAWEKNFLQLKANEEELNRIFIDIYGLQDELTPDVEDKDVTVHRIYDSKEDVPESMKGSNYVLTKQDVVKSLISYAVGCMFGRYSLDKEGLVYAGGEWDDSNYVAFPADKDAIIPICDDEYFNDDIVARFVEFIKVVYGEATLEENLIFIAEALGGNGSARDVIRAYFINGFYSDHCKTYQKRPIYWLFDSGKKNGFKCLIYMHRYHKDTVARVRTDYLHQQQSRYRTNMEDLKNRINNATSTGMRVKLEKQLVALEAQAAEAFAYEEKMKHLADQMLEIDLDDGVKHNYAIFQDVLAKIK